MSRREESFAVQKFHERGLDPKEHLHRNGRGPEQIVVTDRALRESGDEAVEALVASNARRPGMFVRGGLSVRVADDENSAPLIQEVTNDVMRYELAQVADFVAVNGRGESKKVYPPRDLISYARASTGLELPPLVGITLVPVMRPDGTILTEAGYDQATGLLYAPPPGFSVNVPEHPSRDDARSAVELLHEWIGEFPYADQAAAANTLALPLTNAVRPAIEGLVPMAGIDKPTPGTGASLLVDVITLASTGQSAGARGAPEGDDEMRKQITAALREDKRMIFFDNAAGEIRQPSLARALTAPVWEDRILGISATARLPQRAVWAVTGNNLRLSTEIARRSYWIRLDAKVEHPWEGRQFRHPDLPRWTWANRKRLLSAILTIARYWFVKGKPATEGLPVLGSFEPWSETIGGILACAEVEGFLGNTSALYERTIDDSGAWYAFLYEWQKAYAGEPQKANTVADDLYKPESQALREALPDEFGLIDPNNRDKHLARKLGKALQARDGRRHGPDGLHIKRAGKRQNAVLWTVASHDPDVDDKPVSFVSSVSHSPTGASTGAPTRARGVEDTNETNQTNTASSSEGPTSSYKQAPANNDIQLQGLATAQEEAKEREGGNTSSNTSLSSGSSALGESAPDHVVVVVGEQQPRQYGLTAEQVEEYKRLVSEGMMPEIARATVRGEDWVEF